MEVLRRDHGLTSRLRIGQTSVAGRASRLPKNSKPGQSTTLADKTDMIAIKLSGIDGFDAGADSDKRRGPPTIAVNGPFEYARQDLNLQPLAPESNGDALQAVIDQRVKPTKSAVCTPVCTNTPNEPHQDPLADFVANLTPEQRQRIADLLVSSKEEDAP
jgi:hypothetical protein